ncbi:MAG: VOC family protein [Eubacteriales bacterium]|nr:VOC family protein [Eubacteriales bacterium]
MFRMLSQVYVKNSAEAYRVYRDAFQAQDGYRAELPDGTVVHQELNIRTCSLAVGELNSSSRAGEGAVTGNHMQFCLQFEEGDEALLTHAYEVLSQGAQIIYAPLGSLSFSPLGAELVDRYGVWWCLFL